MTDYQRVNRICTDSSDASKYKSLFAQGYEDLEQANTHFQSAFGDSFAYLEPTIYQLAQQAAQSTFSAPDLSSRKEICVSDSFASSMSLDMVRPDPAHPTHPAQIPCSSGRCPPLAGRSCRAASSRFSSSSVSSATRTHYATPTPLLRFALFWSVRSKRFCKRARSLSDEQASSLAWRFWKHVFLCF